MTTYYIEATNGEQCRHRGRIMEQAAQAHVKRCIGRLGKLTILECLEGGRTFFRFYPSFHRSGNLRIPRTFLVRSRPVELRS